MSDPAIRVQGLWKRFRLGTDAPYGRLSEAIQDWAVRAVRWPWERLRGRRAVDSAPLREIWALRDVSFEVQPGEIVGIIGRNGAGKTTLLKILSRILHPTRGRVEIVGRVGSLLEMGTGFHPELTGRENVFVNGAILGMTRAEIRRKFEQIVAFAEIEPFLDTPVKRYSTGMTIRLAFAVAAHLEPEILLVDEVLAVGDVAFQKKCLGKMDEVGRQGRTVLIVSHNLPIIANLCSRAMLLEAGSIVAAGPAPEVVQKYLATVRSAAGELVWPDLDHAPGNHLVRLRRVRILQEGIEGPTADVDIARDILVEITYEALCEGTPLYAGLWLKDPLGTFILSSHNAHSQNLTPDAWYGRPYPRGVFRTICRLPGNFLNEGRYLVIPLLGRVPQPAMVLEEATLAFDVHDTGAMREEYTGSWAGPVIRPRLAWHTEPASVEPIQGPPSGTPPICGGTGPVATEEAPRQE